KFFTKEGANINGEKEIIPALESFLNSTDALIDKVSSNVTSTRNEPNEIQDDKSKKKGNNVDAAKNMKETRKKVWSMVKVITPNLMKMYLSFQAGGNEKVPVKVTVLSILKTLLKQLTDLKVVEENQRETLYELLSIILGTNIKEWDEKKDKKLRA